MRTNGFRTSCQLATRAVALAFTSCSSPAKPPSRPATRIYDRSMAQLGVIELVVDEPARAKKAQDLLRQVEVAFVEAEARRRVAAELAMGLASSGEPTDEDIRAAFRLMDRAASEAFTRYVAVQLELRRVLTRAEFEKLSKVR